MHQQNSNPIPKKKLQTSLKILVNQISRQKLLPKIIWNASKQFGSKRLVNYQRQVRRQYENQLRNPLKYNESQAKSSRQKFRDKITKLMNNQLEVDYLENIKLNDKTLVTYLGDQLEKSKIQTKSTHLSYKEQYQIFSNFNQKKFNETYSNLFEDKLELGYDNLYSKKTKNRSTTLHLIQDKYNHNSQQVINQLNPLKTKNIRINTQLSKKSSKRNHTVQILSARKKPIINFNEKKTVGHRLNINQEQSSIRIIRQIGGYSQQIPIGQLILTKQSIDKWLKFYYQKSNRIFDFFQIKEVLNMTDFCDISRKLRVMPVDHILFMTFLYFDGNNDGYICDFDLQRLSNISLKRPVLAHDYQKLKQSNIKRKLTKRQSYFELYKLSQITESVYFDWKKKNNESGQEYGVQIELKNRILSSKQKHIFLNFKAFQSIYKNDKPFLWYDLLYLFSGIAYHGLKYN